MKFMRTAFFTLMMGFSVGVVNAQVSRPLPASSNNTSQISSKLVFPAPTELPSNLCTESNGKCYSPGNPMPVPAASYVTCSNGVLANSQAACAGLISNQGEIVKLYSASYETSHQYWQTNLVACIKGSTSTIRSSLGSYPNSGECPAGSGPNFVFYGMAAYTGPDN